MNPEEKAVLDGLSFFQELPPDALEGVAERMVRREVPQGWILFRTGDQPRGFFVLAKGRVEIFRSSPGGREQVLHTELPIRSIAELPLFDGEEYPASARAAEASELYFLSRDDFQHLCHQYPSINDAVILELGRRVRKLVQLVDRLSLKAVPARVAAALLDEAAAQDSLQDGGQFQMKRTQEELAHALGTTRESVARALASFRVRGLIEQAGSHVALLSVADLSRLERGE